MEKKPMTITGMTLKFALVGVFSLAFAYLLMGPIVSIKVGAIITAAVLAPGIILSIYQQVRLRRKLSREKAP
jgi:hypothetical protein